MDKANPQYIKVREKIAKQMFGAAVLSDLTEEDLEESPYDLEDDWKEFKLHKGDVNFWLEQAESILSIEGIVILDEDQSLPKNPYEPYLDDNVNYGRYAQSQQDMLNFKKVIK